MYYSRQISPKVSKLAKGFPIIVLTGPRQSGKTTFIKHYFHKYSYFNLENPQTRTLIANDPQQFFQQNPEKIIIDEVQRLPELFSYIQSHVDSNPKMGTIILSGSQNLLISEKINQSLAGRAAYQTLYPYSLNELQKHKLDIKNRYGQMIKGFYPALYSRKISPQDYYAQYISTYVERDARLIKNIQNLSLFQKFISLLAGRVGQVLNISSLANDVGLSPNATGDWISILEASYLVFRLQPYYRNFGKRLIKSPKIYFYDTGLLCSLLTISSTKELISHYAVGSIFENFIVADIKKTLSVKGKPNIYFYRDSHGNEIDLLVQKGNTIIPVEIKASSTYNASFWKGLAYWRQNINKKAAGYLIYGGRYKQKVKQDYLIGWESVKEINLE